MTSLLNTNEGKWLFGGLESQYIKVDLNSIIKETLLPEKQKIMVIDCNIPDQKWRA